MKFLQKFRPSIRSHLNSLSLIGDGDDVDILTDVEAAFEISISNQEAEAAKTMKDLEALVSSKISHLTKDDLTWALLKTIASRYQNSETQIDRETYFFDLHAAVNQKSQNS